MKKKSIALFKKKGRKSSLILSQLLNSSSNQNYFFLPFRENKTGRAQIPSSISIQSRRWNNSLFQSNRHRPQSSINVSFKERNPFAESSPRNHESRGPQLSQT